MRILLAILMMITLKCVGQDSLSFRTIAPWADTVASINNIDNLIIKSDSQVILIKLTNRSFSIINRSDSFIKIKRIDYQMDMVGSEIEINGEWKELQGIDYSFISCGNSYWTLSLEPKNYISYFFDIPDESN